MNRIDLEGRVAVVTGGAQGIGLAITERFLASGARVVIWDIDGKAMDDTVARLAKEHAGRVGGQRVELTDDAAVAAATAKTLADAGRIDILVNNAGITGGNGTTWELDPAVWRRTIEVNLIGPYLTCRHVVPVMMRAAGGQANGQGYGRIVNIASVAGKEGNPNASHYSASKAGVIALTKSLSKELATKGILVNAIAPAVAKTAMFAQMKQEHIDYMLGKIPMGRFVSVDEIAAMAAWLASEDCSFSTAAVFDITGGRSTY
ncbi:MAG: SDR family oxidoreductase [Rubrivivax sp.]|nr:SDR family oxidoreductase [Rubrivivax sp.]